MSPARRCALLLLVAASLATACDSPTGADGAPRAITALPRALSATERDVIAASNAFGFRLLRELNADTPDSNIFLSPLSASMALGMALDGAASTTFEEMRAALGLEALGYDDIGLGYQSLITLLRGLDRHVDFRIANALFYDTFFAPAVEPSFLDRTASFYGAQVSPLDFGAPSAVDTINEWVRRGTNGRIDTILDQLDPSLVMVLLNAIYFKGDWRDRFDPGRTRDLPFTALDGSVADVPTMRRTGSFRVGATADAGMIELPYGGDAFVMTILLPNEGRSVNSLVGGLTAEEWNTALATLIDARNDQELYLPKFRLRWSDTLDAALRRLGMLHAFTPSEADFTRISAAAGRDLYVSDVRQKTFVDVSEQGTEAAAVTSVGIGYVSLPMPIHVDRPFVFVLRERLSGTILFAGKIVRLPAG